MKISFSPSFSKFIKNLAMETPEKFTFFYRKESPFSQFHPAPFSSVSMDFSKSDATTPPEIEKVKFLHCEMWMMYHKAKLFGDEDTAKKILASSQPQKCKVLGRQVKNFDQTLWSEHNRAIIYAGNREKFTQNPILLQKLMSTRGTTLVEASPRDKIYGIGLAEDDPRARSRATWRGQNLLGQVLTDLKEELNKPPVN